MCNPTLIFAGVQVASGVMQARNQVAEGKATNAYYDYLSKQNEVQAGLAERTGQAQSRIIQDTAAKEGRKFSEQGAQDRASQKAALSAAGVSGITSEDVFSSSYRNQLLDEASLRYNADIKSYEATESAKSNAYSLRSQAVGYQAAGKNALLASKRSAAGTLLGTAASVFNPFAASKFVIPGLGGYGLRTPFGTKNMGTWSKFRGK